MLRRGAATIYSSVQNIITITIQRYIEQRTPSTDVNLKEFILRANEMGNRNPNYEQEHKN